MPAPQAEETRSRRAAKKERTRSLLVEAAAGVIAERGFHAASLAEIAARAGLTTGAVYSNFRSKENLFLAVIRETAVPLDLGLDSQPLADRLRGAAERAMRGLEAPESRRLLKLQLEFALLTVQNPRLMDELVSDTRADDAHLATLLLRAESVPRPSFTPSPEQLATAIIATVQGLQQHRLLDAGAVPEELAGWVIQSLLYVAAGMGPAEPGGEAG
jgi:AcrR family transcriptional regulator